MKCRHCGSENNLSIETKIVHREKTYKYYSCTSCSTERARKYRLTATGKEAIRRATANFRLKHPERGSIYVDVWRKIPPAPCEIEGCKSVYKTHKHHPDYSKPLDVIHLCPAHHKEAHATISL